MQEEISESVVCAYISSMREAAEQSLKSLDSSINWALTSTMATLAFSISAIIENVRMDGDVIGFLLSILGVCISMQFHFAIRSAKNYLNILRFSKLEREAVKYAFKTEGADLSKLKTAIIEYHIEWKSPVTLGCVAKKVVFEFGFFYTAMISTMLFIFIAVKLPIEKFYEPIIILLLVIMGSICELFMFSHSPYIRSIRLDMDVQAKR